MIDKALMEKNDIRNRRCSIHEPFYGNIPLELEFNHSVCVTSIKDKAMTACYRP